MYRAMLFIQWKQVKFLLLPFVVAAFGLPLLYVQGMGTPAEAGQDIMAFVILGMNQAWLPAFPALAAVIGVTMALSAWNWDHQQNHVYSLSLPLPRWQYALLKMGAGATFTFIPTVAFAIGAYVAAASVALPQGLHAYPGTLTIRFLLAMLLAYGLLFALAAGTIRTTIAVVTGLTLFLLVGGSLNDFLAHYFQFFQNTNVMEAFFDILAGRHGPLEVFAGSWALFDV